MDEHTVNEIRVVGKQNILAYIIIAGLSAGTAFISLFGYEIAVWFAYPIAHGFVSHYPAASSILYFFVPMAVSSFLAALVIVGLVASIFEGFTGLFIPRRGRLLLFWFVAFMVGIQATLEISNSVPGQNGPVFWPLAIFGLIVSALMWLPLFATRRPQPLAITQQ